MKLDPKWRMPLILIGLAVAAYLGYRWWTNRNSSSSPTGSLGTNLNSVAPELIGGSTGPSSGLTYDQGTTVLDISEPSSQDQTSTQNNPPPPQPKQNPCPAIAVAMCPKGYVRGPGTKDENGCPRPGKCVKQTKKKTLPPVKNPLPIHKPVKKAA